MDPVIIYRSEDGRTRIDVRLEEQTVWLSQKQLTELFGKAKGTISQHIKHIFEDNELEKGAVVRLLRTTALSLPIDQRADVAAELLASLDDADNEDEGEVEAAWAAEIDRRARRVMAGETAGMAWEDVRRRGEAALHKR